MKVLTLLLIALGTNAWSMEFTCVDKNKQTGVLIIDSYNHAVQWYPNRARASVGQAIGKETAPYSPWKGFALYRLTQWPMTNDSSWILAIDPSNANYPKVVVYYDNDDHPENERFFSCYRTKY